jgi:vacuolar-type H+-ATPase subunit E/Vma4
LALDRQSIEKRDFPFGRRGYEPAAVDAHLAALAREIEDLKRHQTAAPPASAAAAAAPAPARRESLASVASAQVQAIVEAAESSAAAIERDAREHAEQTAQDAARERQRIRDEAIERSQEHVGKVHEATALMLQRVDAMEGELAALVESLRTGANRLNADLSLLSGNMGELYAAAGRPLHDSGSAATIVDADDVLIEEADVVSLVDDDESERDQADAGDTAPAAARAGAGEDDLEGARLIALNMALNGQSREETDKYLAENFDLGDRAALLDEVYATVEG